MDGQDAGAHLVRVLDVVALVPQGRPVAVAGRAFDEPALYGLAAAACPGALDAVREAVGAAAEEGRALGEVVVVPGADGPDGDDGPQALDAGGGDAVGDGSVVALADHADGSGGPVGGGPRRAGAGGVAVGAAVQPVDDGLGGLDVGAAADVDAAVGAVGSGEVDQDDGVAARHKEIVVVQGELNGVPLGVVGLLLALVAAPAAGVVRAGVHDDGHLQALLGGFPGADDVDGDAVGAPVAVAVEPGVHPDGFADGTVVGVDGSALARRPRTVRGGGGVGGARCRQENGHQGGQGRQYGLGPGYAGLPRAYGHGRTVARSTPGQKGVDGGPEVDVDGRHDGRMSITCRNAPWT